MLETLFRYLRKRQRQFDLRTLWPVCKQEARSLEIARAAFAYHCSIDPAWTKDYSEEELMKFIEELQ